MKTAAEHNLLHAVLGLGLPTHLADGDPGHIAAHQAIHAAVGLGLPTVISPGDSGHSAASAALATWLAANTVVVPTGADLRAAMAAQPSAATFLLGAGTYNIGSTPIVPQAGDVLIGQPVTVGPNGEIDAPTKIVGTSVDGVFRSPSNAAPFRAENVDVSGSAQTGFHHFSAFALTLRYSRVHDCLQTALGAHGNSLIEHVEIDHNGSPTFLANFTGGGIKIAFSTNVVIRFAYVHDNIGPGVWWDCDERAGTIEDSLVVRNSRSGIYVEISSGDAGGFFIRRNTVQNNNTSGAAVHAGIFIQDSQNVSITDNVLGGNGRGINLDQDSRSINGHAGCNSGFPNLSITGSGNVLNGDSSDL